MRWKEWARGHLRLIVGIVAAGIVAWGVFGNHDGGGCNDQASFGTHPTWCGPAGY